MSFNPYTPPGTPLGQDQPPVPAGGGPLDWEPTEASGRAWEAVKNHFWILVGAFAVVSVIQGVVQNILQQIFVTVDPMQFQNIRNMDELLELYQDMALKGYVISAIMYPVQAFFKAGLGKMWLATARGGVPNFGDAFAGGSRFLPMLGAILLKNIMIAIGFVLFIVPGVYLWLALFQVEYFVIDRNMGPIEAIKASFDATKDQKGKIFLYGLVSFGIAILGFLACCVGMFVALPVIYVGQAIIFTRMTGTTGMPGGFSGYGPPGGGYGPPGYGPPGYGPPGYGPPGGGPPPGYGPPGGGYGPPGGGGYGPPGGGGYGPPGGGPPPGYGPPRGY